MRLQDKKIMVIAPHADDEWFSCGGTLLKLGPTCDILPVLVVAGTFTLSAENRVVPWETRIDEFGKVAKLYTKRDPRVLIAGVEDGRMWESGLDEYPINRLVSMMDRIVCEFKPDVLVIPGVSHHQDHIVTRQACFASLRQSSSQWVPTVMAYEEVGCAWSLIGPQFQPNLFVDVTGVFETKMAVYHDLYVSQASKEARQAYSSSGLIAHALFRGQQCHAKYAEAFMLLRGMLS